MKKEKTSVKIRIISITLVILSGIVGVFVYFWFNFGLITDDYARQQQHLNIYIKASEQLKSIWKHGDIDSLWKQGKLNCNQLLGDQKKTNDAYLRCNPDFIQCYIDYLNQNKINHLEVIQSNQKIGLKLNKFKNGKFYKLIAKSTHQGRNLPNYGIMVELSIIGKKVDIFRIILEDTCSDVLLPERLYALGEMLKGSEEDWIWDNFHQKIFIDKHLVTNRDVLEWSKHDRNISKEKINYDSINLSAPATELELDQMRKFCMFRGKKLLSAKVFDAATFIPVKKEETNKDMIIRSPWPFSKRLKDGFIYKSREQEFYELTKHDCKYGFVLECYDLLSYEYYNFWSPSWIGITGSLGGYMEVFENKINPKKNLKASSSYFPVNSKVHALGRRYYWDGDGHFISNFKFDETVDVNYLSGDKIKVAFRCMRVSNEN